MASGNANDTLNPINWGTSTGGAPGSAEDVTTIGTDRLDVIAPPDQYHISNEQISHLRDFGQAVSQTFKGGTRLGTLTQTSTPFNANEVGLWVGTDGYVHFANNGTDSKLAVNTGASSVSSVSNSDGTLTVTPTTGAAVASLNLAHANTWSGQQSFSGGLTQGSSYINGTSATFAVPVNGTSFDSTNAAALGIARTNATSVYIGGTNVTGNLTLNPGSASIAFAGSAIPTTNNSYVLGSSSAVWSQVNSSFFYTVGGGGFDASSSSPGTIYFGANNATGIVIGKNGITTSLVSNQINIGNGSANNLIIGAIQTTASTTGPQLEIEASGGGNSTGAAAGGTGGPFVLLGGTGGNGSGSQNPGAGGNTSVQGGHGGSSGSGNAAGGWLYLEGGQGSGTGANGQVQIGQTYASAIGLGRSGITTTVSGYLAADHLMCSLAAPSLSAGTGAGSSPTTSVSGTNISGTISITTGTSPATSAAIATLTFSSAYSAAPRVILTPCNAAASALSGAQKAFVDSASTTSSVFVMKSGSSALAASTAYIWTYQILQ